MPQSAKAAIKCMRLAHEARILWIDAVCIDQTNVSGREHQVALMRNVYSNSQHNLIYLGEADNTARAALESIEYIIQEIREKTDDFRSLGDVLPQRNFNMPGDEVSDSTFFVDQNALQEFLGFLWFQSVDAS